jgi:hypothetical protein
MNINYDSKVSIQTKKTNVVLVALGTATGDVLAVDIITNKKIWTNSSCHSGYAKFLITNHFL